MVNRNFTADGPNRLWVADATRIPTGEGVFWLAAVRDVFSRRIVGWKTSDRCDTDLILAALEYGIWSRDVRDGQLIHHSDRGSNPGFNRSSQHLTGEVNRWRMGRGRNRFGRIEAKFRHRAGRRWRGVRIASSSGRQSGLV